MRSGRKIPTIGLGCWKIPNDVCADAVYNAIEAGYRLLDGASDYGNEKEVGQGIARAIEAGLVKREDLCVLSKLWNNYHQPEHVELACKKTLEDLGLDYVDVYLIHFPIHLKFIPIETRYPTGWFHDPDVENPCMAPDETVTFAQTYGAMEKLVQKGLVKDIGVCNIGTCMLRELMISSTIKPAVLQVEMHPFLTQKNLLRYAQSTGVVVMAFSNLGAASYVELGMAKPEDFVLTTETVTNLAAKHNRTAGQIVLKWGNQRSTVIIPKTIKKERLVENCSLFDFELSAEDMTAIDGLNQNRRFNDPAHFCEAAFNTFFPIYD